MSFTYAPHYKQESVYHFTKIIGKYMGYYIHRPILPNDLDTELKITNDRYVNRPDLLAYDYYGDEDLWWVIPVRNGLQDPVFDLKRGVVIMIPDPFEVRRIV